MKKKVQIVLFAIILAEISSVHLGYANDNQQDYSQTDKNKRSFYVFDKQDINKDGVVSKLEMLDDAQKRFAAMDLNKDNKVTKEEVTEYYKSLNKTCPCNKL